MCHSEPPKPRSGGGRSRNPAPKHANRSVGWGFLAVYAARNDTQYDSPMFIGHDALSFAAKRVTPRVSLGLLIAAPSLLDLLWPIFLLLGVEHVRSFALWSLVGFLVAWSALLLWILPLWGMWIDRR